MPTGIYLRKYITLAEYLRKRSISDASGCIIWRGTTTKGGYGTCHHISADGRRLHTTAHRAAYIDAFGPVPKGTEIDHLCKNTLCINTQHLEAVTHLENVRRSVKSNQTHCVHGHKFTKANTYLKKCDRTRVCRQCAAKRQRDRRKMSHD